MKVAILSALLVAFAMPLAAQRRDSTPASTSYIGVAVREADQQEAERLKVAIGSVVIESVSPDQAGARAGLQAGDVVLEFDGERVRSARQFVRLVRESAPDRAVQVRVARNGDRRDLTVTPTAQADAFFNREDLRGALDRLADLPFEFDIPRVVLAPRTRLGATLEPLTPQLADYFGAKGGLLVSSVAEGTPAARAGLKAGDVIASVNGREIASGADLTRELRSAEAREQVKLGIVRDKKTMELTAQIDAGRPRQNRPVRPVRGSRPV